MRKYFRNSFLIIVIHFFLNVSHISAQSGTMDHLNYVANKITSETLPPATLVELEAGRAELKNKFMEMIGLNPLPEKTPLNVKYVGDAVDLGNCMFQRVVFESRPKVYVAAHLYIPKNVTFPVPGIIHVPGHGRRDAYRAHPRTYAENGFVAIGLPMVGEEGKIGSGWNSCGEHGAYVGHFNWYNTGYTPVGPSVWDAIRTVDFLYTLTDSNGVKLVNKNKIGMTGLSGGSAKTLWTTMADSRITCAVVSQGLTAIEHYNTPGGISSTCDIHLFYNYLGLSYGELYSLIVPRALLVQHGTEDKFYPNPQPVVDYLKKIYNLYDKPENFSFLTHNQAHGYSSGIWNAENNWMDKWLRDGNSPLQIYDIFDTELTCFPNGEPADMVHIEQLYTLTTPELDVNSLEEYNHFKDTLLSKLRTKVIRTAFLDIDAELETVNKESFSAYYVEEKKLKIDEGTLSLKGYFFCKPNEKRKTVILTSLNYFSKTTLTTLYKDNYLNSDINLFYVEITGASYNRWLSSDHYLYDRFAQIVGHTHASLQINDILAAVKTIALEEYVDPNGIYLWGERDIAVPVLYSAVVDGNVAGVVLKDAQDKHIGITPVMDSKCNTALFNILKYADIPQVAGLIYPRTLILAGDKGSGFDWTETLYQKLDSENSFHKVDDSVKNILQIITDDKLFISTTFTPKDSFSSGVEGPAVDSEGNIYAVNYGTRGTIGKVTSEGVTSKFVTLPNGSIGNGIRFNSKEEMFIADYQNHNILKVNMITKNIEIFAHDSGMNQPNDIAITDNDIIYASDPNWGNNTGNLWMIDTTGTTHLLVSNMGTTNGVEVSPDNKTLYVNESVQNRVLAFDILSDGTVNNKRVLKQYDDGSVLDGMRCDSLGNIYIACYNKGKIYIISPSGEAIREIELIGTNATNITFGGTDGKTCYVTVANNENIETFRTNTPGRSWVMRNQITGIKNGQSSNFPKGFKLEQNYPNPFNPSTSICYTLPQQAIVNLSVYNVLGEKVVELVNGNRNAGYHEINFNASSLASGTYVYKISANDYVASNKMVILK